MLSTESEVTKNDRKIRFSHSLSLSLCVLLRYNLLHSRYTSRIQIPIPAPRSAVGCLVVASKHACKRDRQSRRVQNTQHQQHLHDALNLRICISTQIGRIHELRFHFVPVPAFADVKRLVSNLLRRFPIYIFVLLSCESSRGFSGCESRRNENSASGQARISNNTGTQPSYHHAGQRECRQLRHLIVHIRPGDDVRKRTVRRRVVGHRYQRAARSVRHQISQGEENEAGSSEFKRGRVREAFFIHLPYCMDFDSFRRRSRTVGGSSTWHWTNWS